MARDLLLELGTEDLPARYVVPLTEALRKGLADGLQKHGVACQQVRGYATPRRIAAWLTALAERQPDQQIERLGPALATAIKDGQPTPAALGFARSCGVDFEALGQKDGKLHFVKTQPGRETIALLPEIFEETLKQMDELVPKRMRWGSSEETFVRPVQWLLCLFGEQVVPLQRFGLRAGNLSYGHRFHAPAAITIRHPGEYEDALRAAMVWADLDGRKAEIRGQVEACAAALGGVARITEDLLEEVAALVEYPVALSGRMEARFMALPPEVIVSTVETNQRYFTVFADERFERLLPHFITVANIASQDVSQVVSGNERVVRPRLADALFFWEQDRRQPLAAYGDRLAGVTFQQALGSVADKVGRIRQLATYIAGELGQPAAEVERAAALCKNDLVTRMVFEFPELQGLIGGEYARASGEPSSVSRAIREHYLPTQQGTPIPATPEGQILALADKLDTLAGIFAIGQKPTASKDPYALRRAALGVLRICIEGGLALDLRKLLASALAAQPVKARDPALPEVLLEFVLERLRAWLVGQTLDGRPVAVETFEAVRALNIAVPLDFQQRVLAVHGFVGHPAAAVLAAAHKRIRNILRQAGVSGGTVDVARLEHPAEQALHQRLEAVAQQNAQATDYAGQLLNLASLREPVDAFFDGVMVNAEDAGLRANRLALLARLDAMCRNVADISLLPGS
jgi:glycyl-tRNA synthetase beta chain